MNDIDNCSRDHRAEDRERSLRPRLYTDSATPADNRPQVSVIARRVLRGRNRGIKEWVLYIRRARLLVAIRDAWTCLCSQARPSETANVVRAAIAGVDIVDGASVNSGESQPSLESLLFG